MEEKLKDYDFYKLVCNTDETIYYIGSTSNMKKRIEKHKSSCSKINCKMYNCKIYNIIRANGGFDNFKFINLGNIKNVTKEEAHHTEQAFINLYKPNMNTVNSYVTEEQKKEQMKNYNETNKEKLKEYREGNKEKLREFYKENKEKIAAQQKEYYNKNKEKCTQYQNEYDKERYKQNKEKISERYKEKITCECGCILTKYNLTKHIRSTKHINLMNGKEQLSEKSKENITCECGCILTKGNLAKHKKTQKHINLMKNNVSPILN